MKRVFQVSEITQLCKDIKSILEQCKEHVSAMRTYADQAGEALDAVPSEARYGIAVHDVSQLRSALKTEQMETALTKLEKCRQRACDLIPAADTDYASQTRELAGVTKSLQTLLEEMEQFLIDTPLTTDYSAFKKAFEEVQARWNKVTENGEKAVEKLMANIKGAEAICHAFSKDPVNLSTGNFIYDRTDLEVGGRESFAFRRFYNAINAHRGVLGKDWNHNYEVHLEFTDGEAVLLREDGKEERFFWEKDRYLSLFASEGALEKEKNGYTYRTRAQKTYRFDKEGKCLETESLTGSRITFAYEEEAPFRLVKVQKETGEFFAFFYDTEGMLERVEDHTGRGVAYRYQGELLKEATLPDGNAFRYGYTSQGKLEQVENPREIVTVENFFDEENRTTLQKFPDGTQMSYVYDEEKKTVELTERNGSRVVYVHDDKYRDIKHIHSNGEERFAYNQNNQKTLYVDRLGNKTQYAYDPAGNLVRVIDALGNKTEIRYGEKNEPTGIRINGKEKLCGEYDAQGRLVKTKDALGNEVEIAYTASGWPQSIRQADKSRITLSYDARGNITAMEDAQGNVTRYGYDAFGNRTWKEERGEQTSYQYNALNQMVSERQGEIRKEYGYDKRGNLTAILENGAWKKQYVYGAMNRLEEAVDAAGKQARYQYNGLGHRVGKQEGVLPKEKLEKLDPQRRVGMEIGNSRQITYTLDLTRQYYNLLEKTEESRSQRYFWDGNVAAYEENGERNYYLQDELGSPLRIEDSAGTIKESYGYGAFGEDLYQNQGEMQPFGYTGYQRDEIAGTYYAQAREYLAESGRFAGQDLIAGFMDLPFSMNRYSYCFNTPVVLVDLDGAWPKWITDIGGAIDEGVQWVENKVSSAIRWGYEEIWSKHIYGEDLVLYETTTGGGSYEVTSHRGGSIIVAQKDILGNFTGWTLDLSINLPHGLKVGSKLTGKDWNPETWKYNHGIEYTNQDTGISYKGGTYMDKNGIGYNHVYGGTSGNLPLELPDSTKIDEYADVSWSFSQDFQISNWKLILETVGVVTAAILFVVVVLDDATIVGVLDDAALAPLAAYIASVAPSFYQWFINSAPKMATCGG